MTEKTVHELDGRRWVWNGESWYDAKTYEKPSAVVLQKLMPVVKGAIDRKDDTITDFQEMLDVAQVRRRNGDLQRAERLVRRALSQRPDHWGALAILCSVLRAMLRPEEAVAASEAISRKTGYAPLLTCRAAALCDVGRWEEALALLGRIQAKGPGLEAVVQVRRRIRAERPDLFDDGDDA